MLSHAMKINRKQVRKINIRQRTFKVNIATGRREYYLRVEVMICNKDKQIYSTLNLKFYTIFIKGITHINTQRRQWHPTPVLLPGKSHGGRSLVGCSPCGREEQDTTERLPFHFSLSCIGEGNGSPLQCSCLENPRDGRAWWAAVYGVAQSRTQLKRLSSIDD